ncbi:4a-hydroxytetrahydrobiopterin dehydratase [Moraxella nasibovis]|uniref:4a-hydroxytetrahydrobiopterin dehydratase n=1 Tax=Moraxella nasibovis TaxID=2904120 RepID=UPI0024104686|nr:4a-hydroxytetrahydrobiopterin dehydratase [Moraxella nasibovis]WFF38516.1 4a-hydroxytetrahydrobiopterin dehydratase [Moraxella nasibovis]
MSSLKPDQVALQLESLPAWQLDGHSLVRTYEFADFASVVAFIVKVSFHAQELEHYPEWENCYTTLRVRIGNIERGAVRNRDVQLAKRLEASFHG